MTSEEAYQVALERIEAARRLRKTLLNLSNLGLTTIPSEIWTLTQLATLSLNRNKLTTIPPEIGNLTKLRELSLYDNQLTTIPPEIGNLTKLTTLALHRNLLTSLPPEIANLTKLDRLWIYNNKLKMLPSEITNLSLEFRWGESIHHGKIAIVNNPLESPPSEIVKQGMKAVRAYFKQLKEQGKDKIFEAKLMIVGEPGSGKTTLMEKLFDRDFEVPQPEQQSTVGIEVRQNLKFNYNLDTEFKAHIWDFGGQNIQYMLHQFFLTTNCVYVLMAEKRRELANFDYWLNIINILGKNSPVIILFNEINIDSVSSFIFDEKKYKEDLFPELNLQRLDVNLANMKDGRFDVTVKTLEESLCNLQHIGKEVPARWVDIRRELENRKVKKHIEIGEYFDICKEFGITEEEDQLLILKYFHLLGVVLHFSEDENLSEILFLDPNWAVDAVYSVLTDKKVEKSKGMVEKSALENVWKKKKYNFQERNMLLRLMLKDNFDICYKLAGSDDKYIIPLLLSKVQPGYKWEIEDNLQFRFQYPFMPQGIVSRLIVRMNEYVEPRKVWNEGMVISKNEANAQIIEKKTAKEGLKIIEIRLRGNPNSRKELLTLIREEIYKIQNSSFPNLPYSEMVPCNCSECNTNPYFFDYSDIETYLQKGKTKIDCRKSAEPVSIPGLVGSVFNVEEIETRMAKLMDENKNINIYLSNIGNPQIDANIQANLTATQQQMVTVTQQIQTARGLFKNLKEDILGEIDIEIDDEKEKKRVANELNKADNAFKELEKAASEGKKELDESTKSRLSEFIDNLSDENSRIRKALKLVEKGAKKTQGLAKIYNKFAPYFALPSVPDIFLGKQK